MVVDHSMWQFLMNSGPIVKLVLIILLIASIVSWTFIFQRYKYLKLMKQANADFEADFWSGQDITNVYQKYQQEQNGQEGVAAIFQAGFKEFLKLKARSGVKLDALLAAVTRAMQVAENKELAKLEKHLPFLASVGSTSPYVGLFGTVWGIMVSFQALGSAQQATIAMVAPGISEALIATAMGLFAAIPAVIAYNRYNTAIDEMAMHYSTFQEEFINILHREMHGLKPATVTHASVSSSSSEETEIAEQPAA